MKQITLAIIVCISILFSNCTKDENLLAPADPTLTAQSLTDQDSRNNLVAKAQFGDEVTLNYGEAVLVLPSNVKVRFHDVKEDSRCPTGVTCFWEGRAVIQLAFSKDDMAIMREVATESTMSDPTTAASEFGITVKLLKVNPYPTVEVPQLPKDVYQITILIEDGMKDGDEG